MPVILSIDMTGLKRKYIENNKYIGILIISYLSNWKECHLLYEFVIGEEGIAKGKVKEIIPIFGETLGKLHSTTTGFPL